MKREKDRLKKRWNRFYKDKNKRCKVLQLNKNYKYNNN